MNNDKGTWDSVYLERLCDHMNVYVSTPSLLGHVSQEIYCACIYMSMYIIVY